MRGFLIMIVAVVLFVLIAPVGFLLGMRAGGKYFYNIARSIDQTGNAICGTLFNVTLIKDTVIEFGNEDQTVSDVLYRNKKINNLTRAGKCLEWVLETIDPGHLANSYEPDEK